MSAYSQTRFISVALDLDGNMGRAFAAGITLLFGLTGREVSASPTDPSAWPDLEVAASTSGEDGSKDAALVIAIENYAFIPDVAGARSNGLAWYNWLSDTRRVPLVKTLFNEQADKVEILQNVERVASRVQPGGRLWIIYIGHGAPSERTGDGLLIGFDAKQTANSLEDRGIPRGALIAAAERSMPADAELVIVQDACFSGRAHGGLEDLAPGMAPLKVVHAAVGARTTVLAAAQGDEYAGPLSDGSRPAFSYLLLGALRGWGDKDKNGQVSATEAVHYVQDALLLTVNGRSQTPGLEGQDLLLGTSSKETAPNLRAIALTTTQSNISTPDRTENSMAPIGAPDIDRSGHPSGPDAMSNSADAATVLVPRQGSAQVGRTWRPVLRTAGLSFTVLGAASFAGGIVQRREVASSVDGMPINEAVRAARLPNIAMVGGLAAASVGLTAVGVSLIPTKDGASLSVEVRR